MTIVGVRRSTDNVSKETGAVKAENQDSFPETGQTGFAEPLQLFDDSDACIASQASDSVGRRRYDINTAVAAPMVVVADRRALGEGDLIMACWSVLN